MNPTRYVFLTIMIVSAAVARLLPHPPNVTPIGAMALFAGACFADRRLAYLVPLAALLLSDVAIGFHQTMPWVYASTAITVWLGGSVRRLPTLPVIGATSLLGTLQFFVVTNLGVWVAGDLYPRTIAGLLTCYTAGMPFLRNAVIGDLFYTATMFGLLVFAVKRYPDLREPVPGGYRIASANAPCHR
jgi:hypothetical protein